MPWNAQAFGDGEGDGVLVDIEVGMECNRGHGVVVSSHSLDETERILPRSEDVRAALPTRVIRVSMDGKHVASFNSRAADAVRAVSHKV